MSGGGRIVMTKAIILSAGLGTRLRPVTSDKPKALAKIDGIPLIDYAVMHCKFYGIKDIIINIRHFAEQIVEHVKSRNNYDINIEFSDETTALLETGGGIKKAEWFFGDCKNVLAYNVDILTDIDINELISFHRSQSSLATLAVRNRKTSRYLLFDQANRMVGWKNMATNETLIKAIPESRIKLLAFSGIQVLSTWIFRFFDNYPDRFSITDAYIDLCKNRQILGFLHDSSFWMDIGKIDMLAEADRILSADNFLKQKFH
jgi:NDP-sugar pyrophosphorylase family protein